MGLGLGLELEVRGGFLRVVVVVEPRTEREAKGGHELHKGYVAVAVVVDELDELVELRAVHLAIRPW
mgnify:FL=1